MLSEFALELAYSCKQDSKYTQKLEIEIKIHSQLQNYVNFGRKILKNLFISSYFRHFLFMFICSFAEKSELMNMFICS